MFGFFRKIWCTLFSCSLRFESCLSAMLPTTSDIQGTSKSPPVTNFPIDAVVQDRVNEYNIDFIILLTFQLHMVIFDRDNFFLIFTKNCYRFQAHHLSNIFIKLRENKSLNRKYSLTMKINSHKNTCRR